MPLIVTAAMRARVITFVVESTLTYVRPWFCSDVGDGKFTVCAPPVASSK